MTRLSYERLRGAASGTLMYQFRPDEAREIADLFKRPRVDHG